MGLRVEIALLFIINVIWIRHALCGGYSTNSETNKWTCTCFIEDLNFVPANCSSSCDCSPVSRNKWTCICSTSGWPRLAGADNDKGCFKSCNCEAGQTKFKPPMPIGILLLIVFSSVSGLLVFAVVLTLLLICVFDRKRISCSSGTDLEN